MGMFVRDLERMAGFYKEVLGFIESDRGVGRGFHVVFLTRDSNEHHQLVLSSGRPETSGPTHAVQQMSFKVDSLDDLRAMQALVAARSDVSDVVTADHGNAWSLYFRDPEENRIEIYVDTPWHVSQPHRAELDLSLTDAEIRRRTEERTHNDPTRKPMDAWRGQQAKRLREAGVS
jgi:catechol-2,3-dioxygenase